MIIDATDDTIIQFGKHTGKRLGDVPPDYLIYIYDENYDMPPEIKKYIEEVRPFLEKEVNLKRFGR